jgi:uncharacterized surface protein with fasciclin (FAS1) repeats
MIPHDGNRDTLPPTRRDGMKRYWFAVFCLILCVALFGCAKKEKPAEEPPTQQVTEAPKTIIDVAVADGRFTTLVKAVQAAGLVETLSGAGPFTVFAPTDEAFAKLPPGTIDALLADPAKLKDILLYHVVAGKNMAADVQANPSATTAFGEPVAIAVTDGVVMVGGAAVIAADIEASNGVIHVIDTVLIPPVKK